MEWELYQFDNKPLYGYPENGYEVGVNLDDVMMSEYPLVDIFDDVVLMGKELTFRDVLEQTGFLNARYSYDTVIELIRR